MPDATSALAPPSSSSYDVARPADTRTVAQRMAGTAVAASGIIAAILFFALHLPWYIFLLPALVGVITGAWWGNDGGKDRRR